MLNSFHANADGSFAIAGIPEPSTWTVMILGFGMLGAAQRRQRKLKVAEAA